MHPVRKNFIGKAIVSVSAAARTASCSHGWLRRVVEASFALLTAASFILIMVMTFSGRPQPSRDSYASKCVVVGCRVICEDVDLEKESRNMTNALEIAEVSCVRVLVTMRYPIFANATIPSYWLSGTRTNVVKMVIFGGNLRHISPQAFMTQFGGNIECLLLENVTVSKLEPETLVGLSSLYKLYIRDTRIGIIKRNALEAVDDSLQILTITGSGKWNPRNLTGTSNLINLHKVDFSTNIFTDIIDRNTFTRLRHCKVLFLNSCGISAIKLGAFDYMKEIEIIYLNNNNLMHLPAGLFDKLVDLPVYPRPRLNLQDNPWICLCSETELRRLTSKGMLLVDVMCQSPENVRGVYFSQFSRSCTRNDSQANSLDSRIHTDENVEKLNLNGSCLFEKDSADIIWNSPIESLHCSIEIAAKFKKSGILHLSEYDLDSLVNSYKEAIIKPTFALKYGNYSMVEITSQGSSTEYGLLWYQSKCPREVYCVRRLPIFLRIYNMETSSKYTFCPLRLQSEQIDNCISYNLDLEITSKTWKAFKIVLYLSVGLCSLIFGALLVYGLIRRYPTLLRGNDRILFVKHKTVDALILPPKVPLRKNELDKPVWPSCKDNGIFVIHESHKHAPTDNFLRTKSIRSGKSITPTYVSALEPTEDQLAEWRLKHHFDKISIATSSVTLDVSTCSCNSENNSLYYAVSDGNKIYESLN